MYEQILTNVMKAAVPTKPGVYLMRLNLHEGYPFVFRTLKRKWWLFGPVGFRDHTGFHAATVWTAQHYRVPAR